MNNDNIDINSLLEQSEDLLSDINLENITADNITDILENDLQQTQEVQHEQQNVIVNQENDEKRGTKRPFQQVYQPYTNMPFTFDFNQFGMMPQVPNIQNGMPNQFPFQRKIMPAMPGQIPMQPQFFNNPQLQIRPPQVMTSNYVPSMRDLMECTAKVKKVSTGDSETKYLKHWPKLYGELFSEIKFNNPSIATLDKTALNMRVFVSQYPSSNTIMVFHDKLYIGNLPSEYSFMSTILRSKTIVLGIEVLNIFEWKMDIIIKVYIKKKAVDTTPIVDTTLTPEMEEAMDETKHALSPLKKLFDLIDSKDKQDAKVEEENNDTSLDDDDLDDLGNLDDELDEYIEWNGREQIEKNIQERDMEGQLNELYKAVTKSVDETDTEDIKEPPGLAVKLREYQKVAMVWMANRERKGRDDANVPKLHPLFKEMQFKDGTKFYFNPLTGQMTLKFVNAPPDPRGGILADEMGLGKTIEMLSLIMLNKSDIKSPSFDPNTKKYITGMTLVVCPLTLVDQWKSECEKHTNPPLKVYIYQGSRRIKDVLKLMNFDIIITTYNTLSFEYNQITSKDDPNKLEPQKKKKKMETSPLYQIKFHRVILDEAHNIKNRKSLQARATTAVDADCRWAVTGTPIHNHIDDLFSLFNFLRVNPHGDWRWWSKNIAKPFEKKKPEAVKALQSVMSELLIRRTKNKKINGQKIINLPTKSVHIMELEFNHAERALYDSLYEFSKGKFEEFVRSGTVLKNYANILEMLLHLRQACDHPALILQSFQNKINTENLRAFFEQFSHGSNYEICRQILPILPQVLNDEDADIDALMEKNWVGSTKINSLVEQLQELKHTTKSVIFSQWTTMLDLVEIAFDRGNINYVRLDGKMSRRDRDKALHTFRTDPNVHACLFSLKAGGVGLNLVQATHVFLLDPWWNPAVEEQAINRVHRIGQNKPVVVVRFVIKNTIEQRILKLQENKNELAQGLGMQDGDDDGDEQLKLGMTKKDLQQIRLEDLHSMFADDDKDEDKDELDVDDDEFTDL